MLVEAVEIPARRTVHHPAFGVVAVGFVHRAADQVVAAGGEPGLHGAEHRLPVRVERDALQAVAVDDQVVRGPGVRDARDVHDREGHVEAAHRRGASGLRDRFRDQVHRVHAEPVSGQEQGARANPRSQLQRRGPLPVEAETGDRFLQEAA